MPELKTIWELVKNRLPFLTDALKPFGEDFKLEVFITLNDCFKKEGPDIGDEDKYEPIEKLMVADLVALLMLNRKMLVDSTGTVDTGDSSGSKTFLKKAKAGDAEAEFEAYAKEGFAFGMNTANLMAELKKSAVDRFSKYPCYSSMLDMVLSDMIVTFRASGSVSCPETRKYC